MSISFQIHRCECAVYSLMKDNEAAAKLMMLPCYYSRNMTEDEDGVLILKDLSKDGVSKQTVVEPLNLPQLLQVTKHKL